MSKFDDVNGQNVDTPTRKGCLEMKVKYLENQILTYEFTPGKEYEVLKISYDSIAVKYYVIDDNGKMSFLMEGECEVTEK